MLVDSGSAARWSYVKLAESTVVHGHAGRGVCAVLARSWVSHMRSFWSGFKKLGARCSKEKPSPFLQVVDGLLAAGAGAALLLLGGIGRGASLGPEDSSVNLAVAAVSLRAEAFGAAFFLVRASSPRWPRLGPPMTD